MAQLHKGQPLHSYSTKRQRSAGLLDQKNKNDRSAHGARTHDLAITSLAPYPTELQSLNRLNFVGQERSSVDQGEALRAHSQAALINLHFLTRRDGVMLRDARGVPRDEGLLTSRAQALLQARGHN